MKLMMRSNILFLLLAHLAPQLHPLCAPLLRLRLAQNRLLQRLPLLSLLLIPLLLLHLSKHTFSQRAEGDQPPNPPLLPMLPLAPFPLHPLTLHTNPFLHPLSRIPLISLMMIMVITIPFLLLLYRRILHRMTFLSS